MLTNELINAIAMHQTTLFLLQRRILFQENRGKKFYNCIKTLFQIILF